MRWGIACVVALTVAGCASTPPEEDPVQIKLKDLDTRLSRVDRVISNQSLLELANQVDALRSDVRTLHNDVDVLSHNLELSRKQQRDLYADLDRRLKIFEARGGAGTSGAAAAGGAGPSEAAGAAAGSAVSGGAPGPETAGGAEGADKGVYQAAFDLLKDAQYDRAISSFQNFLATYPTSSLADNAQYWLGEAFYVNRQFREALTAFQRVVDKYPTSRKLPDALLKIGFCDYEMKEYSAARAVLSQVATQFPDAPAARLAQQRLDKMTAERH